VEFGSGIYEGEYVIQDGEDICRRIMEVLDLPFFPE